MVKLRSKKLFKTSSKVGICSGGGDGGGGGGKCRREIEWELRPCGLLVQKREAIGADESKAMINVRVSTGLRWLHISISATATFGELKVIVSMETGLEPREQRLLFKGKEKEDGDHLHMVGVKEGDKVLLLEDPAIKERKLRSIGSAMKAMEIKGSCPAAIPA
ncbi:BAG family molecular chaperone regulator 1-like isoform X1 [Dendrobium catenatum]|uniref:BAG family molecular chaperone regulator 1 n=1 Tax=Dendrobium catenatum TaxID=906689 RepID=A0A2I0VEK8_9ASPA|nr:BAG family molecular chaperone regulator 1-like isoform X1 [Dendrobium catenatum]PKU61841.1 BAG family molecular chaperone regulator 1 [Dendrobium catenatum]